MTNKKGLVRPALFSCVKPALEQKQGHQHKDNGNNGYRDHAEGHEALVDIEMLARLSIKIGCIHSIPRGVLLPHL